MVVIVVISQLENQYDIKIRCKFLVENSENVASDASCTLYIYGKEITIKILSRVIKSIICKSVLKNLTKNNNAEQFQQLMPANFD
ncbi:hypothetical protein T03_9384 [Trichinella britovi]|uniref:Uncharacterized protein n=1 Tax=Trichinella britovi TaxID=45882 RepID=A0A0V1CQL2_TRIBR|nr:hypothetical protein T03_9384 [Trichinella britovi]